MTRDREGDDGIGQDEAEDSGLYVSDINVRPLADTHVPTKRAWTDGTALCYSAFP